VLLEALWTDRGRQPIYRGLRPLGTVRSHNPSTPRTAEGADEGGDQPDHRERHTQGEPDTLVGEDTAENPVEVERLHAPTYGPKNRWASLLARAPAFAGRLAEGVSCAPFYSTGVLAGAAVIWPTWRSRDVVRSFVTYTCRSRRQYGQAYRSRLDICLTG
jgi:hypothetical protein